MTNCHFLLSLLTAFFISSVCGHENETQVFQSNKTVHLLNSTLEISSFNHSSLLKEEQQSLQESLPEVNETHQNKPQNVQNDTRNETQPENIQTIHSENHTLASKDALIPDEQPDPESNLSENQEETNSATAEEERTLQIAHVAKLLEQEEELRHNLLLYHIEQSEAVESLHDSIARKKSLEADTNHIQQLRRYTEYRLNQIRFAFPRYEETLEILHRQAQEGLRDIYRLRSQGFWLVREKHRLANALRQKGLEHWVEQSVKDSVSPFLSDALVQGTASVVEPMLNGIEKLAAAESDFSKRMSAKLTHRVPIIQKPFYAGFVTYSVLLFPTVLVFSLVLKLKRGFASLSLGHVVILGNFYLLLLSGGCFVATIIGAVDVLQTFRHHNRQLFDFIMLVHGVLFTIHISFQTIIAKSTKDRESARHVFLLTAIGLHFFVHSYRRAMNQEDPHVDKGAYLCYTGIFLFMLFEQTVKRITRTQSKKVMTLNNTSISCAENDEERGLPVSSPGTGPVESKFPSSRSRFLRNQVPYIRDSATALRPMAMTSSQSEAIISFTTAQRNGKSSGVQIPTYSSSAVDSTAAQEL